MNNRDMKSENAVNSEAMTVLLDPCEVAVVLEVALKAVHKLVREVKLTCVQVSARYRHFTLEQMKKRHELLPIRRTPHCRNDAAPQFVSSKCVREHGRHE